MVAVLVTIEPAASGVTRTTMAVSYTHLFALIVLMLFNASGRAQLLAMGSLTLLLVCIYFLGEKLRERKAA